MEFLAGGSISLPWPAAWWTVARVARVAQRRPPMLVLSVGGGRDCSGEPAAVGAPAAVWRAGRRCGRTLGPGYPWPRAQPSLEGLRHHLSSPPVHVGSHAPRRQRIGDAGLPLAVQAFLFSYLHSIVSPLFSFM